MAATPEVDETVLEPTADEEGVLGTSVRYSSRQLMRTRDLLSRIDAARRAARFYPPAHPLSQETVSDLFDALRALHRDEVDVQLTFYQGEVLMGDQLLPEESVLFDGLARDISASGGRTFLFKRGLTPIEVRSFIGCLAAGEDEIRKRGGLAEMLSAEGVANIRVSAVGMLGDDVALESGPSDAYTDAITLVHEIDRKEFAGGVPDVRRTNRVVRSLVDNVLTDRAAILRLTGLHDFDQYTFYHSANVGVLSVAIGSMISQDHRFLSILGVAGLLHDVGKLALSSEIINKPGALSPDEWAAMRAHPVIGAQMVAAMPGIDKAAVVAVLEHHQRFDGTGYPKPLGSQRQHLVSRIIALADAYDAMTSRRSYSAARQHDQALSIITSSMGTSFDPALVQLLIKMLGVYPPRSIVRLSDGALGIVIEASESAERPTVRVVADSQELFITPYDVNLEEHSELSVTGSVDPRLTNIVIDDYI